MRHPAFLSAALLASLALGACAQAPEATQASAPPPAATGGVQRATANGLAPLDKKKFGAAITETNTVPLDVLMQDPAKFASKPVRTEGVVFAVCREMGCWMEIKDQAGQAHIKMAGHAFFMPKDASGHRAVIQGRVIPPAGGPKDHCTAEAEEQTGAVAKIQMEATGVEFLD